MDPDQPSLGNRADHFLGRTLLRAIALIPGLTGLGVVTWSLLSFRSGGPGTWIDLAFGLGLLLVARWLWHMKRTLSDLLDEA